MDFFISSRDSGEGAPWKEARLEEKQSVQVRRIEGWTVERSSIARSRRRCCGRDRMVGSMRGGKSVTTSEGKRRRNLDSQRRVQKGEEKEEKGLECR